MGAVVMNGPLGDETKMNQHLATNVILVGCETEELEEAYKILMLGGVDLRFSGLTRELQPAVWTRIRQVVACLFSAGQHRKATKVLARHIIAVNPDVDREKMLRGLKFDKEYLLVNWSLCDCKISVLPRSFSALEVRASNHSGGATSFTAKQKEDISIIRAFGFEEDHISDEEIVSHMQSTKCRAEQLVDEFYAKGRLVRTGDLYLNNNQ